LARSRSELAFFFSERRTGLFFLVRGFSPGGVDAYSPNGDFGRPCRGARRSNGCYDLFHPGHVCLLKSAAAECDRLIVAINSDESVRRLGRRLVHKPSRPFQIWPDAWLDQRSSERKKDTSVPTIAGRLPLTPALSRRVRVPLQSAEDTACCLRYTDRRLHRSSSLITY